MNLRRALTRETRYSVVKRQTSRIARIAASACSRGTNTPRSRDKRGVEDCPPPTRIAKPSRPSLRVPTSATQLISGALQWAGEAAVVILCLRGRSEYLRVPYKNAG